MARKHRALTGDDYVKIGRRASSEDVALEAGEVSKRWARDVAVLAAYGHGPTALAAFDQRRADHAALRSARPVAIAAKSTAIASRTSAYREAKNWFGMVGSLLGTVARGDQAFADRLNAATPADASEYEAKISAMRSLLAERQSTLGEAAVATRLSEADALVPRLAAAHGDAAVAKAAPVEETETIDRADGELYEDIRQLNEAGRRAVRAGALPASALAEYTFHHLDRHTGAQAKANPATPAKPT
ncbi:MAG: hypothetical protein U0234_03135 [Sandaracinus sp.]